MRDCICHFKLDVNPKCSSTHLFCLDRLLINFKSFSLASLARLKSRLLARWWHPCFTQASCFLPLPCLQVPALRWVLDSSLCLRSQESQAEPFEKYYKCFVHLWVFGKLPFDTSVTLLLLHILGACMVQQSELRTMLKCRLLLTKLHQSHSFTDTPDNSRSQEQTILKDLLLWFSIFNLSLLKLRGGKEGENTKKCPEASSTVRGPTILHPSQAPSVLGFVPLCLSLLHSQSRAYC